MVRVVRLALAAALTSLALLRAESAAAVEKEPIRIVDRWSVIGVISESETHGIAVLRNNQSHRTFTLSLGDAVPNEFGFALVSVANRKVVIGNGKEKVTLAFAESDIAGDDAQPSRTAQFIDNYYRGLHESPIEILNRNAEEVPAERPTEGAVLPLKRFGSLRDEAQSRFELYRSDRVYGGEADAGEAESGFTVNYDNFDDQTDGGGEPLDGEAAMVTE